MDPALYTAATALMHTLRCALMWRLHPEAQRWDTVRTLQFWSARIRYLEAWDPEGAATYYGTDERGQSWHTRYLAEARAMADECRAMLDRVNAGMPALATS